MRRGITVSLALLILLIFSSCYGNSDNTKAPQWMRGRSWSGEYSEYAEGSSNASNTGRINIQIDAYGNPAISDEGAIIISSASSGNTYEIEYLFKEDGVEERISLKFSKVNDDSCNLAGTRVYSELDSAMKWNTITTKLVGTLKANQKQII